MRNILQINPEMSQLESPSAVGVNVGGIRYALIALINRVLVKLNNFTATEGKRGYAYVLTPKGITRKAAPMQSFVKRKLEEYEALFPEFDDTLPLGSKY